MKKKKARAVVSLAHTRARQAGSLDRIHPETAMVLTAGLGKRMRPLTAVTPKPLIEVCGKPIVDYGLDRLKAAGLKRAVLNTHYLPDQIRDYAVRYRGLDLAISEESDTLLDTGGGIKKALPLLGNDPFYLLNGDSFWIEGARPNLAWLNESWNGDIMDILLLLSPTVGAVGYEGPGDFLFGPDGALQRRPEKRIAPYVYAGAAIIHPRVFDDAPEGAFSLNLLFDQLIEQGRLHGVRMDGTWLHVGTPEAGREAEFAIGESAA